MATLGAERMFALAISDATAPDQRSRALPIRSNASSRTDGPIITASPANRVPHPHSHRAPVEPSRLGSRTTPPRPSPLFHPSMLSVGWMKEAVAMVQWIEKEYSWLLDIRRQGQRVRVERAVERFDARPCRRMKVVYHPQKVHQPWTALKEAKKWASKDLAMERQFIAAWKLAGRQLQTR
ncbi:hypothetical protein OF846_002494 [Rhodotorula toruloides]|nr:hypothetical protein OF846_002494 [Rhodotorula toruloides]